MAFDRQRFLGLTVVDFSANVGWNDESSSVRIKLAPEDGESLTNAGIGTVQQFTLGGFTFTGLIERIIERHDTGGNFFEVTLSDGKEILRSITCVVNNLYGSTDSAEDCAVPNYFNIFRYYERNGYGASGVTESGMKRGMFVGGVSALSSICKAKSIGGDVFTVNVSEAFEDLPEDYRIPGPYVNLLDAVSAACDDSGKLWQVKISGTSINVAVRKMNNSDPNSNVSGTIRGRTGDARVISWDVGTESASGLINNSVVFGGAKENSVSFGRTSYSDATIKQFWGYFSDGTPAAAADNWQLQPLYNAKGQAISIYNTSYTLPVIGLEDIFGGDRYGFTAVELAFVMGGQDSWEFWLELYGNYQQIFLKAPRTFGPDKLAWLKYGGAGTWPLKREFSEKDNDVGVKRAARVYSYLRSMCESYWGKQFLVQVNSSGSGGIKDPSFGNGEGANTVGGLTVRNKLERKPKQDGEASDTYNFVPSSSGWVDPAYSLPFIPKEVLDGLFKDSLGKMLNWFQFPVGAGTFTVDDSSPDCFVSGNRVYLKATVSDGYVKVGGTEHVHCSLGQAVLETPPFTGPFAQMGRADIVTHLFDLFVPLTMGQSFLLKCGYYPYPAESCLLGFKATTNDVYGPWYSAGGGGATRVDVDAGLTPWSLGSGQKLAEAGASKAGDKGTISSVETGSYTIVAKPDSGLGDSLGAGGAVVTSVSANYGPNGITTTYSFRTFVPKFGITSKTFIDKLKNNAIKQNEDRRNIYKAYMDTIARQQASYRAMMGSKIRSFFLDFLGRRHDRMSPHACIMLGVGVANAGAGAFAGFGDVSRSKCLGGSYKYDEAVKDVGQLGYFIDDSSRAIASLDSLFVPFRNFPSYGLLPSIGLILHNKLLGQRFQYGPDFELYKRGDGETDPRQGKVPTSKTYNAFKVLSHIDCLVDKNRDYYDNHNEPQNYGRDGSGGAVTLDVNAIALRGPLMVSGWGINLWTGEIEPPSNGYNWTSRYFPTKVALMCPWEGVEQKRTGPVDLIWDASRGVWTSHDVVRIKPTRRKIEKTSGGYNPNGRIKSTLVNIYANDLLDDREEAEIQVFNLSSKEQPQGLETLAHYSVFDNRWYVEGKGCHARYWDKKTVESIYEASEIEIKVGNNLNNPKSNLPYYIDFVVQEKVVDPYTEVVKDANGNAVVNPITGKVVRAPEHYCVDLIQTSGMSGPFTVKVGEFTCPGGSKAGSYMSLWFFHGLAKEVLYSADNCPDQPPTTPPGGGRCYLYKNTETNCHFCSSAEIGIGAIELVDAGGFETCEDCQGVIQSYDEASGCVTTTLQPTTPPPPTTTIVPVCYLVQDNDTQCWYCSQNEPYGGSDGQFATCEECEPVARSRNEDVPGCAPSCYMYLDPLTGCWYCSTDFTSPDDPFLGGEYATCKDCEAAAETINKESVICNPTTTLPPTTTVAPSCYLVQDNDTQCWYCTQNPPDGGAGVDGSYATCEECDPEAKLRNADIPGCGSTTTTTPEPTTTPPGTTTTLPPGCVDVVSKVYCDANGDIKTEMTRVKSCDTPLVAQSNIMEVRLLRAEVKTLNRKLMDIIELLQKNNIEVFK